jgi:uncharacterized protein
MREPKMLATAHDESGVWLETPSGPIAGIITRPVKPGSRGGVLLCGGGWYGTVTNRNRVYVRLARRLAAAGYHVLRFDWRGVGESAGHIERFDLEAPFVDDVVAAGRYLESESGGDLVVVGSCFGARAALAAATQDLSLRGLVLVSFPVPKPAVAMKSQWYSRRLSLAMLTRTASQAWAISGLLDARVRRMYRKVLKFKWRSLKARLRGRENPRTRTQLKAGDLLSQLEQMVERNVSVLFFFGEDDLALHVFNEFAQGKLNPLLERPEPLVHIKCAPGDMHTFDTLAAQDEFLEHVTAWVAGEHDQDALPPDQAAAVVATTQSVVTSAGHGTGEASSAQ